MKVTRRSLVFVLVAGLALSSTVWAGNADPRTWEEDMSIAPWIAHPADWNPVSRTVLPTVAGGAMTWTTGNDWYLVDDATNHYFNGTTKMEVVWKAAPAGAGNVGVGPWLNLFQNGLTGNAATLNALLGRNSNGAQIVNFERQGISVVVAEGPVSLLVTITDPGIGYNGVADYIITDSAGVKTGTLTCVKDITPLSQPAGLTLVAFASSVGSLDYVKVENLVIPEPVTVALLGLGGLFLRKRK